MMVSLGLVLTVIAFLASKFEVQAAGGVAELKALTGDAPYLGWGNQEQAPEYFGDAAIRQYYTNPSYGYAPPSPYSTYNMRNAYYGGGAAYRMPYYQAGVGQGFGGGVSSPAVVQPAVVQPSVTGGSGFYQGSGNDWVKSRK